MDKLVKLGENNLRGINDAYKGETRDWWNKVNEEDIYATIGSKEFENWMNLFVVEGSTRREGFHEAV